METEALDCLDWDDDYLDWDYDDFGYLSDPDDPAMCSYCGDRTHVVNKCRKQRRAYTAEKKGKCLRCGKRGHKTKKCPTQKQQLHS